MSTWYKKAAASIYVALEPLVGPSQARTLMNMVIVTLDKMAESGDREERGVEVGALSGAKYILRIAPRSISWSRLDTSDGFVQRVVWTEE